MSLHHIRGWLIALGVAALLAGVACFFAIAWAEWGTVFSAEDTAMVLLPPERRQHENVEPWVKDWMPSVRRAFSPIKVFPSLFVGLGVVNLAMARKVKGVIAANAAGESAAGA